MIGTQSKGEQLAERLGLTIVGREGHDVKCGCIACDSSDAMRVHRETGIAFWKTLEIGNVRVRMVEYTPGYVADHWCSRGPVLLVLEGQLETELKNGRKYLMSQGMTYQVATDAEPHRSSTKEGAKLFIVD